MTSFKTLDELNEFNNQNFKKVFGNRLDQELFENPFKEGTFENLKAAAVPHKEFEYDKFTYYSIEFADKLLPYIKNSYTSKGVSTFDGANLFESVKRAERKLFAFDDNEYLIKVVNYTYPKGVEAETKKARAIANDNEVLSFVELGENNEIEVHFKFGKRFKNHLEDVLKDKRESAATLENKVYNFNTTSFKKNFEEGMVHDTMMRFVLNTLGVENEAKELASYNKFFTTNVLNYLDDFKILNKYKVHLFIVKSQSEAGLQFGELKHKPVKVLEPLPNEIFVWFVSEDKVKFDTSFIKVKLGTNAAKELLAKEITVDDITNYLLRIIESEIPNGIFNKKRVQKEVNKSAALAVFQLYSKNKIESSPIAKEVFLSSPIAFYAIQGLSYLSEGIEKLKLSDNVWDKRNKDYAPILPNSLENAYVCGLINGSVKFLKDIPDSASFLLSVLNSEQAFNEFVEALRKLFTDTEVLKALFEKSIQGYKEGLYVKNTEKVLYQLGYDTIQIVSFFIGVVQFAKGVASFAKFVKNAIAYLKKNGKKGIGALKKLSPNEISKIYNDLASADSEGKLLKALIKSIEDLKKELKKNNIINKYSDSSLNKLLAAAKKLNLPDEDLLGFIRVGNIKDISFTQLAKQMDNYINIILKRGYPFKFRSLQEFKRFSSDLLNELKKINIPIDDVRVQGSSLRKRIPPPKDIDLAVFVDDNKFYNYLKVAYKNKIKLDGKKVDIEKLSNKELIDLSDKIFSNSDTNSVSRTFANAIESGKISALTKKPRIISQAHRDLITIMNEKYPKLNIDDISVQLRGGKLELKPDLKIKL